MNDVHFPLVHSFAAAALIAHGRDRDGRTYTAPF